jgi:hypothetical protein
MTTSYAKTITSRIYRIVHTVLWIGLAICLAGIVRFLPEASGARARAERHQLMEMVMENKFYCEKWGMAAGTHEHTICTMDIQEIRAKHSMRLADDPFFDK